MEIEHYICMNCGKTLDFNCKQRYMWSHTRPSDPVEFTDHTSGQPKIAQIMSDETYDVSSLCSQCMDKTDSMNHAERKLFQERLDENKIALRKYLKFKRR